MTTWTPARFEKLRRDYADACERYSAEFFRLNSAFLGAIAEAEGIIKHRDDMSSEAEAARAKVRRALHAAAGMTPDSALPALQEETRRLSQEVRLAELALKRMEN